MTCILNNDKDYCPPPLQLAAAPPAAFVAAAAALGAGEILHLKMHVPLQLAAAPPAAQSRPAPPPARAGP